MDASERQVMGSTLEALTLRVEYSVGNPRYLEPKTSTREYDTSDGTSVDEHGVGRADPVEYLVL